MEDLYNDQFAIPSQLASVLQIMLGIPLLEGTNPASSFPQIAIGSEATCYSSIWSEVCT